jgi:penicillin G amidase
MSDPVRPPSSQWPRRLAWTTAAAGLVALALLAAIRIPLPPREGRATLASLISPAEVRFDRRGVPHVRAATEEDAWRVLGWLHAGDRLFQMELRRRAAAGRLSEVFGPAALDFDRRARRARRDEMARRSWEGLAPNQRRVLQAYADGVNAWIEHRPRPLEMLLLGHRPEPWTPLDSLRFERTMAEGLSESLGVKTYRMGLLRRHGAEFLLSYLDAGEEAPTRVPPPELLELLRDGGPPVPRPDGFPAGSNGWAVAGSRSASGAPMLGGDPHLRAELPGVWYAAHLTSEDGLDLAGLTLPGLPGVLIGHNGRVAWTITMQMADDGDLFVEKLSAELDRYLHRGRWLPLGTKPERISVQGGEPYDLTVRWTHRGTLGEPFEAPDGTRVAVARAFAPERSESLLPAFLNAGRAGGTDEFLEAWKAFGGPPINVVWASADGRIGVRSAGAIPRRPEGLDGRLPAPGWTGEADWEGLVPDHELPKVENPPEGFVASANDDWSAAGIRLDHPGLYAGSERVDRIRQVLADGWEVTPEEFRALQNDVLSRYAIRVRDALMSVPLRNPEAQRARAFLARWDGEARRRGPARLFYAFLSGLREETFGSREARLGDRLPAGWTLIGRMIEGTAGEALWDDPETEPVETRESRIEAALRAALRAVEAEDGPVPEAWNWGRVHTLTYRHPFSSQLPWLARWLDPPVLELPGEFHTVSVAGFHLDAGRFDVIHIASARLIVDLGRPDDSRLVLPLGQSGQFQDRRYRDQARAWAEGRDFPFPFTREAVDAAAVGTLLLEP